MPLTRKAIDLQPGDTIRPKPKGTTYTVASVTHVFWKGIELEINGAAVLLSPPRNEVVIVAVVEKGKHYVGQCPHDEQIEIVSRSQAK